MTVFNEDLVVKHILCYVIPGVWFSKPTYMSLVDWSLYGMCFMFYLILQERHA